MLLTLMRKKSLHKVILSDEKENDRWIFDNNSEKLIRIRKCEDKWKIESDKQVKIIERNKF